MREILLIILICLTGCSSQSDYTINQRTLKEYALCECISEGLRREGIKNFDYSAGHLIFNWQIGGLAFSRIDSAINNLYDNSNIDIKHEEGTSKAYFYRCLKFYESNYLDSLVKTMNESIVMNSEDEKYWRESFLSDSIYFEDMIRNSQFGKVEEEGDME